MNEPVRYTVDSVCRGADHRRDGRCDRRL